MIIDLTIMIMIIIEHNFHSSSWPLLPRRSSTLTELVPSVSEPENLNELGLAAAENPEFHFVETKEDSDTEVGGGVLLSAGARCYLVRGNQVYEMKEADLWQHTKPIKVIKDISKKLKMRRAERRR